MKNKFSILSILSLFLLVISLVGCNNETEEKIQYLNYTVIDQMLYMLDNDELTAKATEYYNNNIIWFEIPSEIEAFGRIYIVTEMHSRCFSKTVNPSIQEIYIPGTIKELSGISNISTLRKIHFMEGVEKISYCNLNDSLEEIILPSTLKEIGDSAFSKCPSLTSIKIPSNVEIIDEGAFYNCINLKTIDLENTQVETIGWSAFNGCTSLESIKFPNTLKTIGDSVFSGCEELTISSLQSSIEYIGDNAFTWIKGYELTFDFPNLRYLGYAAFGMCDFKNSDITLPESLEYIDFLSFAYAYGIKSITITSLTCEYSEYVFHNMTNNGPVTIYFPSEASYPNCLFDGENVTVVFY